MKSKFSKKRVFITLLSALISFIVVVGITLSLPIILFNINTMHTASSFGFTDGYARVGADYIGYEDTAEIHVNVRIERRRFLFGYTEIVNESYTAQGSSYQNEFLYPLDRNGTYRCTITYTVTGEEGQDVVTFRDVKSYRADEYSAHTHAWGAPQITKEASCAEEGLSEAFCSCGASESASIPKLAHKPGEIVFVENYLRKYCTVCGEIVFETAGVESTKGLAYRVHSNQKTCTITGIGSCAETDIVIGTHIDGYRITDIAEKAFSYCHSITSVTISDGITKIGKSAFYTCNSLTKISLPSTLTTIENSILYDCRQLTTVIIPDGAQTIEKMAFALCSSLKEISLPDSIKTLGERAFYRCAALETIKLSEGLTAIGESAFESCEQLPHITIPNQVTSIGKHAFSYCYKLETVTLSESLTELGERAFSVCRSLKKIAIPEGLTVLESYVFSSCGSLTEVTLPDSLLHIYRGAFDNCASLKIITLPSKLSFITREAFYQSGIETICYNGTNNEWDSIDKQDGWDKRMPDYTIVYLKGESHNFTYDVNEDGVSCTLTGMGSRSDTTLVIPDTVDGYRVTAIGESVFYGNDKLVRVILPESIKSIGLSAFAQCKNLEEVTLPSGLGYIESLAFFGCEKLESVTIPDTVYYIGEATFASCTKLESVVIPDSVTDLAMGAFEDCISLETVSIGKGLRNLGQFVFRGCTKIAAFDVSAENTAYTAIGGDLYTKDGSTLIRYAVAKTDIFFSVPETVTKIEEAAFEFATHLQSVTVPASVTELGAYAFSGCYSLTEAKLLGNVTEIGEKTFFNCFELTDIRIPDSVTAIGAYAFANCSKLLSVQMPDGVETIGKSAFLDCVSLKSFSIGSGVQKIESHAFNGCVSITEFRYNGTEAEWKTIEKGVYWDGYITKYTVVCLTQG